MSTKLKNVTIYNIDLNKLNVDISSLTPLFSLSSFLTKSPVLMSPVQSLALSLALPLALSLVSPKSVSQTVLVGWVGSFQSQGSLQDVLGDVTGGSVAGAGVLSGGEGVAGPGRDLGQLSRG